MIAVLFSQQLLSVSCLIHLIDDVLSSVRLLLTGPVVTVGGCGGGGSGSPLDVVVLLALDPSSSSSSSSPPVPSRSSSPSRFCPVAKLQLFASSMASNDFGTDLTIPKAFCQRPFPLLDAVDSWRPRPQLLPVDVCWSTTDRRFWPLETVGDLAFGWLEAMSLAMSVWMLSLEPKAWTPMDLWFCVQEIAVTPSNHCVLYILEYLFYVVKVVIVETRSRCGGLQVWRRIQLVLRNHSQDCIDLEWMVQSFFYQELQPFKNSFWAVV